VADITIDPSISAVIHAIAAGNPLSSTVYLATPVNRAIEATPRMQRLRSLSFDRRPAAILKAWAPRPKPGEEQSDLSAPRKPKKKPEEERLDQEIETFQRAVTLSDWPAVNQYFRTLTPIEANAAYGQILKSLSVTPPDPNAARMAMMGMQVMPQI